MQSSVLEAAHAEGVRVVVTVDTGMRSFAEARKPHARLGLDLIVTDHHLADANDRIPDALAILNPNQPGCGYPEKSLCGAAIALKLAQALLERHDASRMHEKISAQFSQDGCHRHHLPTPSRCAARITHHRGALGFVSCAAPSAQACALSSPRPRLDPATKQLTGHDVAFRLAPRINAAGRMDVASEVIELFTTRDVKRAELLAAKFERLNRERRDVEAAALAIIEERLESDTELCADRLLLVDGDGWHRGVIGILASRVVERTAKPTIVVSVEDGPGRSKSPTAPAAFRRWIRFALFHRKLLPICFYTFRRPCLRRWIRPACCGRSPELKPCRLRLYAEEHLAAREPERLLRIHAELPLDRITPVLAGWLHKLEPLGHGNPEPIFVARNARLLTAPRIMKARHLALELAQCFAAPPAPSSNASTASPPAAFSARPPGSPAPVSSIRAVGWGLAERAMEMKLEQGSLIDVAYRIRENDHPDFGGLEIEIMGMQPPASMVDVS